MWEKGGSGLNFYTDAAYWKAQEGDFDEKTADDWDVDMSVYYEKEAGPRAHDKDAVDSVDMRRAEFLHKGKHTDSVFGKRKNVITLFGQCICFCVEIITSIILLVIENN